MERSSLLSGLNEQQREAVQHTDSPLLILAGAGSGKTRVITVKIAYLIRELGVPPESILAVTFTNKAAGEMRGRAAQLEASAERVVMRTFHSFGAWLLRRNAASVGLRSGFSIYDEDDSITLLKTLFPDYQRSALTALMRAISRAKDYALTPTDDLSLVSGDPDFPSEYERYQRRLREIGNVDFGDLITLPLELLRTEPAVADRVRARFRYILVDEYQDSNVAQYYLLRHLTDAKSYICVVGDDDQSIYGFRGAEVRNILTFSETFPGTRVIRLEENYRSTEPILRLASAVVAQNEGRLGKELWTRRTGGARPRVALLADQDAEVRYCLDLVRRARGQSHTAILYRTNAQSRLFETALLREGIPYRIVGTVRFWEREEIKDVVAWLKFLANPKDEVSFRRIVNKPPRGIGATTTERLLAQTAEYGSDLSALLRQAGEFLGGRPAKALSSFTALYDDLMASFGGKTLGAFCELLIERTGLGKYHAEQDEVSGSQKLQNLEELVNAASLYEPTEEGLVEFLETIELDASRERDSDEGEARVTLITMHNTKGLEFDRVVVTGLEEGLFPREGDEDPDRLEEERRLFYVAVTRAQDELHLTSCSLRRLRGRPMELEPSRFLLEIPEEYVEGSSQGSSARRRGGAGAQDRETAYPPGTVVYHDDYGTGIVVKSWMEGAHEVVMVRFESGSTARFLSEFATLERVAQDA
jgi:DNA helicase-2/ATP-dependent DNA helicase PcrA